MKKYNSHTTNGGTTIILDSLDEAIEQGRDYLTRQTNKYRAEAPDSPTTIRYLSREKPVEERKQTSAEFLRKLERRSKDFERAVQAIQSGDPNINQSILEKADELLELVTAIEPSLAASYAGFDRSEEGVAADVGLLASGDDRPFFQRQNKGAIGGQGRRGRAYRLVLNTDVSWFGNPVDNAAVVGALVLCLQRFGPVELWIQQGWLNRVQVFSEPCSRIRLSSWSSTGSNWGIAGAGGGGVNCCGADRSRRA